MGKTQLIVALDYNNFKDAEKLVDTLGDNIEWYKIGSVLFTKEGPEAVSRLKARGKKVFLDLKFHDIPNTVAGAVESCVDLGVNMFTIHASGGKKMISIAEQTAKTAAAKKGIETPKAIAVTMLTSFSAQDIERDFGIKQPAEEIVRKLVSVVVQAGGSGVVASPQELSMIRREFDKNLIVITPGVRPTWAETGDQKRVMTPQQAAQAGADFLVIGRPITASDDPAKATQLIWNEIKEECYGKR